MNSKQAILAIENAFILYIFKVAFITSWHQFWFNLILSYLQD